MIPEILHHIWLSENPIKDTWFRTSFLKHHPLWTLHLWDDKKVQSADISDTVKKICADSSLPYVVRGDCLRFALLEKYGGVYSDFDMLCLKPLDSLLDTKGFTGESYDGQMCNALFGVVPHHPVISEALQSITALILKDPVSCITVPHLACGVVFHAQFLKKLETIHPVHYFCPFKWNDLSGRNKTWPDSYTVHFWAGMDNDGWTHKKF